MGNVAIRDPQGLAHGVQWQRRNRPVTLLADYGEDDWRIELVLLRESLRSRRSFEALHAREQLVLHGKRQEGGARTGTAGGFRRSFGGLLFHPGRGDQAT